MNVRPAYTSDCTHLAAIYQQSLDAKDCCMEVRVDEDYFLKMLERFVDREALLVIEDGDVLHGFGVVKKYSDRIGYRVACETSIYLCRDVTGKGHGSKLQRALMEKVREFRYHHVVTKIWASNLGSIRFHQRFGFEMVGVQKEVGYLGGAWRDVAIMQCILPEVEPFEADLA